MRTLIKMGRGMRETERGGETKGREEKERKREREREREKERETAIKRTFQKFKNL